MSFGKIFKAIHKIHYQATKVWRQEKKCPPTKLPWSLGNQSEEVVLCVQLLSEQWIRNIDFVHKCISLKI